MGNIIEFVNVTKSFGKIIANDNVSFSVKKGEVHALIGENGAGKSTLMSVLFGIYQPDKGFIKVNGNQVEISDPKFATSIGISMVHQHFKLVDVYNAVENIILGREKRTFFLKTDLETPRKRISELSMKFGLEIDLSKKVGKMSVGMQQRVEILKMLYSDADVLIFDEPTAVLSPKEIEGFLDLVNNFKRQGKTIILITHKLEEIKDVADSATIIRRGSVIKSIDVKKTSVREMAKLMVGKEIQEAKNVYSDASKNKNILKISNLTVVDQKTKKKTLNNVSLEVKSGEIVAIAGVEGNGQSELSAVISGLLRQKTGKIFLNGSDISDFSVRKRYEGGLSHVPEDRHKHGLILDMSITENMSSQLFYKHPFSNHGIIRKSAATDFAFEIIHDFDVRGANDGDSIARSLSGGNQQKAIIGREMKKEHSLLLVVQPTRGLDLGAISNIHEAILIEKKLGKGILLISYELNEVLALADRIIVFNDGKITGNVSIKDTSRAQIGEFMASKGEQNE